MKPMDPMDPLAPLPPLSQPLSMSFERWWPDEFGFPSSSGGQNDVRYAFFPEKRRLLVERRGQLAIYNSGDHRISGVSSQQGNGGEPSLTFNSQHGAVRPEDLEIEGASHDRDATRDRKPPSTARDEQAAQPQPRHGGTSPSQPDRKEPTSGGGERVIFSEESRYGSYIQLFAKGELDIDMLEALEEFVTRRKRRLTQS